MTSKSDIRILILEDDRIVARDILEIVEEMGLSGHMVFSYEECMEAGKAMEPHLLLCDINLNSEKTGIDAIKKLQKVVPLIRKIYITAHSDADTLKAVMETNPSNYLVKPFNSDQLKASIRIELQGVYQAQECQQKMSLLSLKEVSILQLIARNRSSRQIAEELFISEKTVRNHRYNIIKKLQLPDQNYSLLIWALKNMPKD